MVNINATLSVFIATPLSAIDGCRDSTDHAIDYLYLPDKNNFLNIQDFGKALAGLRRTF